jgi:CDP-paratose 2-epimerase
VNAGGGVASARSLAQISAWCRARLGDHVVERSEEGRRFDIPWMVLDPALAGELWAWAPVRTTEDIMGEILSHARLHPEWLEISGRG